VVERIREAIELNRVGLPSPMDTEQPGYTPERIALLRSLRRDATRLASELAKPCGFLLKGLDLRRRRI